MIQLPKKFTLNFLCDPADFRVAYVLCWRLKEKGKKTADQFFFFLLIRGDQLNHR